MIEKTIPLFNKEKLTNYARFFGCTVLGIAAIAGMTWAYCGLKSKKQGHCASEEYPDIDVAEKCAVKGWYR